MTLESMVERSFVFIKPEHIEIAQEIFDFLEEQLGDGFERLFNPLHIVNLPKELLEEHYSHRTDSPIYKETLDSFKGKGAVIAIYVGDDIINRIREIVGVTCPKQAKPGTIRAKYGIGSLKESLENGESVKNVIHASGPGEAEQEIETWSKHLAKDYKVLDLTKNQLKDE